jgi:hypothetical protein
VRLELSSCFGFTLRPSPGPVKWRHRSHDDSPRRREVSRPGRRRPRVVRARAHGDPAGNSAGGTSLCGHAAGLVVIAVSRLREAARPCAPWLPDTSGARCR